MKSSSIFWGVFFVSLGALLLLNQFEAINADLGGIVRFWPVLIILFGVSLLNLPDIAKKIVSGAAGLFLALLIFGGITFIISAGSGDSKKADQGKKTITASLIGFIIVIFS